MNKQEREHIIEWLFVMSTGYSKSYFEQLTDEQIERMYEDQVNQKGMF